jgi:hypothetical protein
VRFGGQECGVPQGSVLGSLLFISYIDDVSRVIRYCRFHIHADDLQIYNTYAEVDFQRCFKELNLDLDLDLNGLKLNLVKSQVIVISRCR